jgi:molecular chaperone DnaK (HSP70)
MIQNAVRSLVEEYVNSLSFYLSSNLEISNKVATNVNADEAAVLGAALHGASLSRQFKTKDMKVTDVCPYEIQVSYPSEPKEGSKPRTIQTVVFPLNSKTGSKKVVTFKRKEDFTISLGYKKIPTPYVPFLLSFMILLTNCIVDFPLSCLMPISRVWPKRLQT